jgi:hypothetical protein
LINKTGQGEEGNEDNENKILIFKDMVFECFFFKKKKRGKKGERETIIYKFFRNINHTFNNNLDCLFSYFSCPNFNLIINKMNLRTTII